MIFVFNYRKENKAQEEAKKSSQTVRMKHELSRELAEVIVSRLGWAGLGWLTPEFPPTRRSLLKGLPL